MPIRFTSFPLSTPPSPLTRSVADVFRKQHPAIDSTANQLNSDGVLAVVRPGLEALGFEVETGKRASEKVTVPVLYGEDGEVSKAFDADAWHRELKYVIEVEAGRGYANNQFLKDLFQACMMDSVDHLLVAVRNDYRGSDDYQRIRQFFEALYASRRLALPLREVTILGY